MNIKDMVSFVALKWEEKGILEFYSRDLDIAVNELYVQIHGKQTAPGPGTPCRQLRRRIVNYVCVDPKHGLYRLGGHKTSFLHALEEMEASNV